MSLKYFNPLFAAYLIFLAFFAGACAGSFVNCAVIRLTNKSGSLFGRSRCPDCGHPLGILDLFPVFSYIFLRGKCRYCREKISPRYLLAELCFGACWGVLFAVFGFSRLTLEYILMMTLLCAESLSDIESFEVPNSLHIALIANFALFLFTHDEPLKRLIWGAAAFIIFGAGMLILSLIADKIYKKETLGGADIKLFAVLGLYFGPGKMLFLLIISCIAGLLLTFVTKKSLGSVVPFIPSITLGAFITVLAADPFIEWYMGLFTPR